VHSTLPSHGYNSRAQAGKVAVERATLREMLRHDEKLVPPGVVVGKRRPISKRIKPFELAQPQIRE
jgi:hypothetical protein